MKTKVTLQKAFETIRHFYGSIAEVVNVDVNENEIDIIFKDNNGVYREFYSSSDADFQKVKRYELSKI